MVGRNKGACMKALTRQRFEYTHEGKRSGFLLRASEYSYIEQRLLDGSSVDAEFLNISGKGNCTDIKLVREFLDKPSEF